jgi:hypothetical protein
MQVVPFCPPAGSNGATALVAQPVAPGQRAGTQSPNAAAWLDVARFLVEQRYPGISSRLLTA